MAAYCDATVSILAEDITADSCHIRKESGFKFAPSVSHVMPCCNCNWQCHLPHRVSGSVPCFEVVSEAPENALPARKHILGKT